MPTVQVQIMKGAPVDHIIIGETKLRTVKLFHNGADHEFVTLKTFAKALEFAGGERSAGAFLNQHLAELWGVVVVMGSTKPHENPTPSETFIDETALLHLIFLAETSKAVAMQKALMDMPGLQHHYYELGEANGLSVTYLDREPTLPVVKMPNWADGQLVGGDTASNATKGDQYNNIQVVDAPKGPKQ